MGRAMASADGGGDEQKTSWPEVVGWVTLNASFKITSDDRPDVSTPFYSYTTPLPTDYDPSASSSSSTPATSSSRLLSSASWSAGLLSSARSRPYHQSAVFSPIRTITSAYFYLFTSIPATWLSWKKRVVLFIVEHVLSYKDCMCIV